MARASRPGARDFDFNLRTEGGRGRVKKLRGIPLPEEKQGLVRYTCLCYRDLPKYTQEKIQRLCAEAGGAYSAALWEVMCTRETVTAIALRHHVSEMTLYRARKEFFLRWYGKGKKKA